MDEDSDWDDPDLLDADLIADGTGHRASLGGASIESPDWGSPPGSDDESPFGVGSSTSKANTADAARSTRSPDADSASATPHAAADNSPR
eukprot:gene26685-4260_t